MSLPVVLRPEANRDGVEGGGGYDRTSFGVAGGMRMGEQERAFVEAFIDPARRDRYLLHLASPKNRRKALDRLNHHLDLRAGVASELPANLTPATLIVELKRCGAPDSCYVIADTSDQDGQELLLGEAAGFLLGHPFGVVLCCVPGRLACYKPESPAPLYLLR